MKTVDYVGFAPGHQYPLPICPNCGYSAFRTIESKQSKVAQRRRKKCDNCGHRATTHEVTDEYFQEAKKAIAMLASIKKVLNVSELPVVEARTDVEKALCPGCKYNTGDSCNFGFPEYGTDEASDCIHFKSNGN